MVLISNRDDDVAKVHNKNKWDHGNQPHFWLTNTVIPCSELGSHPVRQRTTSGQADQSTSKDSKIGEADGLSREVVRWRGKYLALG